MPLILSAAGQVGAARLRTEEARALDAAKGGICDPFAEANDAGNVALAHNVDTLRRTNPLRQRTDGLDLACRELGDAELAAIIGRVNKATTPLLVEREKAVSRLDRPLSITDVPDFGQTTKIMNALGDLVETMRLERDVFHAVDVGTRLRELRDYLRECDNPADVGMSLTLAAKEADGEPLVALQRCSPFLRDAITKRLGVDFDTLRRAFLRARFPETFASFEALDELLLAIADDARAAVQAIDAVVGSPGRQGLARIDQVLAPIRNLPRRPGEIDVD